MDHWARTMEEQMAAQREQLRTRDPHEIAHLSGATWEPLGPDEGTLSLSLMHTPVIVRVPGYFVEAPGDNKMLQGLVTAYLLTANGAPRAGEWIAFRELPNGMFYHQAFNGYTGDALARTVDLAGFQRGAEAAGGRALSALGDAAYEFHVLPRLWIAVVYWLGDDEDGFPSKANVLFDRSASHYLITDGLAILASQVTRRIIAGAKR
jgi:hypothetical protein